MRNDVLFNEIVYKQMSTMLCLLHDTRMSWHLPKYPKTPVNQSQMNIVYAKLKYSLKVDGHTKKSKSVRGREEKM